MNATTRRPNRHDLKRWQHRPCSVCLSKHYRDGSRALARLSYASAYPEAPAGWRRLPHLQRAAPQGATP